MILQVQDIPDVTNVFLQNGIMGAFIILVALAYIWERNSREKRDKYIRETSEKMTSVIAEFTSVAKNIQKETESLHTEVEKIPERVKDKIEVLLPKH